MKQKPTESVYWDKDKAFFAYSEVTKLHKTKGRVRTICGKKIGLNPKFGYEEKEEELVCKRCFK